MKYKVFCFSVIATLVITSECQTRRPPSPPRRPPSPPRFQGGPPQHQLVLQRVTIDKNPEIHAARAAPAVLEARSTILKDHFSACQLKQASRFGFSEN
uniref:Putative secreted protein n=1 Tax=Amblyomma triste TaxID=251400 RepID=A0A023G3X8_AMBTT